MLRDAGSIPAASTRANLRINRKLAFLLRFRKSVVSARFMDRSPVANSVANYGENGGQFGLARGAESARQRRQGL